MLTLLQQAQDAFIYGAPFAAIALMRAILEIVLSRHYGAAGKDVNTMIENADPLPDGVARPRLHALRMLARDVLHFKAERVNKGHAHLWAVMKNENEREVEKELVSFFVALRALIEGAPALRP